MRRYLIVAGSLLLAGGLILPLLVYAVGRQLIGRYEGPGGLGGFLGTLYRDAWHGEPAAWILLATPLLLVATWQATRWIRHRIGPAGEPGRQPDQSGQ